MSSKLEVYNHYIADRTDRVRGLSMELESQQLILDRTKNYMMKLRIQKLEYEQEISKMQKAIKELQQNQVDN